MTPDTLSAHARFIASVLADTIVEHGCSAKADAIDHAERCIVALVEEAVRQARAEDERRRLEVG